MEVEQKITFSEIFYVLEEFRLVARPLEVDRKVTMSRAPRLLRDRYCTLHLMAGEMDVKSETIYSEQ